MKNGIKTPASDDVLNKFTYALAEFTDVKGKKFISNPGCYATATELALIPLLKAGVAEEDSIIVDAKSGLTGLVKLYQNQVTLSMCMITT